MKSLLHGCAAAALLMGAAFQAHAEIAVQDAPVHTVPADEDDTSEAAPAQAPAKVEPAPVKALLQAKAPAAAALTPEENAFFAVLGERVTDAASAYENYVRRAGGIDPGFTSGASVQRAVKASAAYHPQQLEAGIVAYAALVALRDQEFVDGVRAIQNPGFIDGLAAHPEAVMQVRGAQAAAIDVAGVLQAQGAALIASGKAVTKAAYDIQAQAWSKSPVADPKGVLDGAKLSAGQMRAATATSKEKLLASLVSAPQNAGSGSGAAPDVVRGLALAAMAIMGKTGDGQEARYEALLHDASSAECLKMAKLNLNQCLAVAGPHYEDVYCAGRHAVSDTGKCIAAAAGGSPADAAAPPPRLQTADAIGPEQAAAYGRTASFGPDDIDEDEAPPAPAAQLATAIPTPPPLPALAAPAPAPRQYAEVQPPPQAELQRIEPQRAETMPDPRASRAPQAYAQNDYARPAYAQSYGAQQPYPQTQYQQPQYPQPQYPQAQYQQPLGYQPQPYQQAQPYQQPAYQQYAQGQPQPQYAPQYQQPQYAQPQYAQPQYQQPQPYQQQPQAYAQNYGGQNYGQQPYYPQDAYQGGGYYGR